MRLQKLGRKETCQGDANVQDTVHYRMSLALLHVNSPALDEVRLPLNESNEFANQLRQLLIGSWSQSGLSAKNARVLTEPEQNEQRFRRRRCNFVARNKSESRHQSTVYTRVQFLRSYSVGAHNLQAVCSLMTTCRWMRTSSSQLTKNSPPSDSCEVSHVTPCSVVLQCSVRSR